MNKMNQTMNTKATLIVIAALTMAACTQKENPVEERTPVALQYTTVDATETKAAQNLNEGTFAERRVRQGAHQQHGRRRMDRL